MGLGTTLGLGGNDDSEVQLTQREPRGRRVPLDATLRYAMIGETTKHYQVIEKLGGGGMGVVYKARDLKLDRLVALKFLPRSMSGDESEERKRFIQEAKVASALDHPNICTVHQIDETDDGQMFIVMAYCQGETLKKKIERGPLALSEALDFAMQVAQGLAKAHREGVVHRDIKPANVIVTTEGVAKVVDFGIARLQETKITQPGARLGTPAYMSPEQAHGDAVDQRTDVWALGVVLYEMISGQLPFKGEYEQAVIYAILHEEPVPVTQIRKDIPWDVENIVAKALAKTPGDRFQSMEAMFGELGKVAGQGETGQQLTAGRTAEPLEKKRRFPIYVGAAALVLLAAAVAGYLAMNQEPVAQVARQEPAPPAVQSAAPPLAPSEPSAAGEDTRPSENQAPRSGDRAEKQAAPSRETVAPTPRTPPTQQRQQPPRPTVSASPAANTPPVPVTEEVPEPEPPSREARSQPAPAAQPEPATNATAGAERSAAQEAVRASPSLPPDPRVQELTQWTRIRESRDIAVFEEFLRAHPDGSLRNEALERVEHLKWEAARSSRDRDAVQQYLREHPNARYGEQARRLLEELRPSDNNAEAIRQVLRRFSDAYQKKDTELIAALWPTLAAEQLKRLADSFRVARTVTYDLQPLADPQVTQNTASVACRRFIRYEDDRGAQRPVQDEVRVVLRKHQGAWLIEAVE